MAPPMAVSGGSFSRGAEAYALAAGAIATCSLSLVCALLCTGCSGTVRSAAANASSAAVPVLVDESLAAFEDPLNRERVEQILGSPEMQRAIVETSRAFVQGAFEPGSETNAQIFAQRLTDSIAETLTRDIREQIVPAAVDAVRGAITPDDQRDLRRAMDAAIREATIAAVQAGSGEMQRSLAPALRSAIVDSLNAPEMRVAVAGVVSDATRAALLSSRDVIVELHENEEHVGPVERIVNRIERLVMIGIAATFALGAALGALVIYVLRRRHGGGASGPPGPQAGATERAEPALTPFDRTPTRAT
jgi:hypothetical protein